MTADFIWSLHGLFCAFIWVSPEVDVGPMSRSTQRDFALLGVIGVAIVIVDFSQGLVVAGAIWLVLASWALHKVTRSGRSTTTEEKTVIQTFRKRPVEVQVMRWNGGSDMDTLTESAMEILQWITDAGVVVEYVHIDEPDDCPASGHVIAIHTLEGVMSASVGDVIVRGVSGEFYPCKPGIFEMTYEAVPS